MSKSSSKSKDKSLSPHLDELDDVDALFLLSEEEPSSKRRSRRSGKVSRSVQKEPPKIVALVSRKGGTGKTSLAMNLAAVLSTSRRRVVVLDLDKGADAAKWQDRGGKLQFAVIRADGKKGEWSLEKSIEKVAAKADLLILDTPPADMQVIEQAVEAADLVLIPTGPSALDLMATVEVVNKSLKMQRGKPNRALRVALVPSRLISGTLLAKELPRRLEKLSLPVAPSIGQRVEVATAGSEGRALRPKSKAGLEISRLARFVLRNLRQT
jgi:chromosome partitioning protein